MPEMSLAEAAAWAGKGRPAILKAIKRQHNRLSARQDDKGQWWIDPAELARVYEPGNSQDASLGNARSSEEQGEHAREVVALMQQLVDAAKQDAAEARRERDDWKEQAGKWEREAEAVRLITHQKSPEAPAQPPAVIPTPAAPPAPRGLRAKLARLIEGR